MNWFDTLLELFLIGVVIWQGAQIVGLRAQLRRRYPSGSPLMDPRHPSSAPRSIPGRGRLPYPTDNLELPL